MDEINRWGRVGVRGRVGGRGRVGVRVGGRVA